MERHAADAAPPDSAGGSEPHSRYRCDAPTSLLASSADSCGFTVSSSSVPALFQRALLSRLAEALAQREEQAAAPKEWVSMEARKRPALQEGGTLR